MKKLMMYGMIGMAVLGAQTMVFANSGSDKVETIKATSIKAVAASTANNTALQKEVNKGDHQLAATLIVDGAVLSEGAVAFTELTAEQKEEMRKEDEKLAKEICEGLGIAYDETKDLGELLGSLTEAQQDTLAEKGILVMMKASTLSEAAVDTLEANTQVKLNAVVIENQK
ncbi:MAG: hypothetical protein ACRCTE_01625 [Cellulosilyticaceae bacterium]